jgi:hypothetical protein
MASRKHTATHEQLSLTFSAAEEWRDVPGYEGYYQVSNLGRVKNARPPTSRPSKRADGTPADIRGGRMLQLYRNKRGYLEVHLCKAGIPRFYTVHRLVLNAFIGPRPERYVCNHIDCDGTNNALSNLEWVTPQENLDHMVSLGRSLRGAKNHNTRLTATDVQDIRRLYAEGMSYEQLAERFGVNRRTTRDVVTYRSWKYLP